MPQFIHYVRRQISSATLGGTAEAWFAEVQPDAQGFEAPSYHVTRSTSGPATRVDSGDVIWLFSQLSTPWGKLPPALDAKICVDEVSIAQENKPSETGGIRYGAGVGSKWFPVLDASPVLGQLRTVSQKGTRPLLTHPAQPVGQALQSMRELADSKVMPEWERVLEEIPVEFISYRLIDGTRMAFEKALQVLKGGHAVFWDRWSLPRRLAERREFLDDEALTTYLIKVMGQCRKVWAIQSARYAEQGSYSARELHEAKQLGTVHYYPA